MAWWNVFWCCALLFLGTSPIGLFAEDAQGNGAVLRNRFFPEENDYLSKAEWPEKPQEIVCKKKLEDLDFSLRLGRLQIKYRRSSTETFRQKTYYNDLLRTLSWTPESVQHEPLARPVFQEGELEAILESLDGDETGTDSLVFELVLIGRDVKPRIPIVILRSKEAPEWEEYVLDFLMDFDDEQLDKFNNPKFDTLGGIFRTPNLLPSVIFIALESTSRPMMKHYAPNFLRYIQSMRKGGDRPDGSHRAFLMEGFHSATFGSTANNLTPLFTGMPHNAPGEDAMESAYVKGCSDYRLSLSREMWYWSKYYEIGYFTVNGNTGQHYWGCWGGGIKDSYSCRTWTKAEQKFLKSMLDRMSKNASKNENFVESELCKLSGDVWQGDEERLQGCGECYCCRHNGNFGTKPKLWRCADMEVSSEARLSLEEYAKGCQAIGGTVREEHNEDSLLGCNCRCCRKTSEYFGREGIFGFAEPFSFLHAQKAWKLNLTRDWNEKSHCVGSRLVHQAHLDELIRTCERVSAPIFAYHHLHSPHYHREFVTVLENSLPKKIDELMEKEPNSIIIIAGDHGPPDKFDQNMPFLSLLMPKPLLKTVNAQKFNVTENLEANEQRLITPTDIFLTFGHILSLFGNGTKTDVCHGENVAAYPQCMLYKGDGTNPYSGYASMTANHKATSLFQRIPANRSCSEAGIGDFHCQEGEWKSLLGRRTKVNYLDLPNQITKEINRYLKTADRENNVCQVLRVRNILSLEQQEKFELSELKDVSYLRTVFDTVDEGLGSVTLNALLSIEEGERGLRVMYISQLTRYNKYEPCVPKGVVAKFCVCNASAIL